jgi:hypothetical protein
MGEGAAKPRERDVILPSLPSPVSLRLTPSPARGEGFDLTPDEKLIFDNALILVLKELHNELDAATAAKTVKPNFPTNAVDQVAAVMAALAQYDDDVTSAKLALGFKQGKKCEPRVAATLASLSRTGFIATTKDNTAFAIRRAG